MTTHTHPRFFITRVLLAVLFSSALFVTMSAMPSVIRPARAASGVASNAAD